MADEAERFSVGSTGSSTNAFGLFPVRAEELSANGFQAVVQIVLNGT